MGWNRELWISFGTNRRGMYSVLSELWEKKARQIFISEGCQGRGWWLSMVAAFEVAERQVVNPESRGKVERMVREVN